jgi:hypothetical protein
METLVGLMGGILRHLAFNTLFFLVGWFVIKCLTLGRYPRTLDPRRPDSPDFELLSVFGLLVLAGSLIFLAWLLR